jgi:amidase
MSDPRTVIGPLACHFGDLALALRLIAGVDWQDSSVMPVPLTEMVDARQAATRVALYVQHRARRPTST